jgi:HSP20 family protein
MTLLRWEPRRDLEQAQKRVRSFFDDFESAIQNGVHMEMGSYSPRVDISEDQQNVYVIAELPGLSEEDVKVTLTDGVLTIRGEKKRKEEHSGHNFFRIERTYGEFVRQFALPENLNDEAVDASFDGGVLEITIPKREPEKPREREVKIGKKA